MAKLVRKDQKIFSVSSSENGQFGSGLVGTKVLSDDPDTLQSLSAWEGGWTDATLGGQKLPPLEEMNGIQYVTTRQLAYLLEQGIPEYSSTSTYYQKSIVCKSGTYELYGSVTDNNTGNALTDGTNWLFLGDLALIPPVPTTGDAGKFLTVNSGETGYELAFPTWEYMSSLIDVSSGITIVSGNPLTTISQAVCFFKKSKAPNSVWICELFFHINVSDSGPVTTGRFDLSGVQGLLFYQTCAGSTNSLPMKVEIIGRTSPNRTEFNLRLPTSSNIQQYLLQGSFILNEEPTTWL